MPTIRDLIGDTIVKANGETLKTESLITDNQIVGLYFSAFWCPPCRGFTPKLVEFYNKFKHKNLEIVFVSSDRDQDQFDEYFTEMPWFALPFEDRDRKAKLSKKFKVQGIPNLVFVEANNAKLITVEGRNNMLDDPEGTGFPWRPLPLGALLRGPLRAQDGTVTDSDTALKGKVVGLYFSAHWCPPCRGFTPTLMETYQKVHEAGKNFEVVLVSSDRSEESFTTYSSSMPWLSIPYGDSRNTDLAKHFGVQGIPTFIILDEKYDIITTNGRSVITRDPTGQDFPWHPKSLNELNDVTAPYLNESACLLFFTDGEEEHIAKSRELLEPIATKYTEEYKANRNTDNEIPELRFLFEGPESEEIAESLRSYAELDDRNPLVAIMDIPEQQFYSVLAEPITTDILQKVVTDYRHNQLTFLPLAR